MTTPVVSAKVESANEIKLGSVDAWSVITRTDDGDGITHLFPKSIFEHRAAEYGIDPHDIDTLMEVVLHEPFHDDTVGPGLFESHSTVQAKEVHLAKVKAAGRTIDVRGSKILDVIRNSHNPDAGKIKELAKVVDITRHETKYGMIDAQPQVMPEPVGRPLGEEYEAFRRKRVKEMLEAGQGTPTAV